MADCTQTTIFLKEFERMLRAQGMYNSKMDLFFTTCLSMVQAWSDAHPFNDVFITTEGSADNG